MWTPSTLKLESLRTRGGSLSLVGMVVMRSKPKSTITRGSTSCVMIAFLSRLEFRNLFMNIALYCCHFKVMPVCSPRKMTTQPQFNKNEFHTSQASEGSTQYIKILSLICNPRKHNRSLRGTNNFKLLFLVALTGTFFFLLNGEKWQRK